MEPELVVEVRYKERTEDGLLRQPVFLRLREDKAPVECEMPTSRGSGLEAAEGSTEAAGEGRSSATRRSGDSGKGCSGAAAAPKLVLSNLDKVFWPEEGYTKGDLIEYYRAISAWLLPFLTAGGGCKCSGSTCSRRIRCTAYTRCIVRTRPPRNCSR